MAEAASFDLFGAASPPTPAQAAPAGRKAVLARTTASERLLAELFPGWDVWRPLTKVPSVRYDRIVVAFIIDGRGTPQQAEQEAAWLEYVRQRLQPGGHLEFLI